jgi:hypothetical protein
MLGVERKDLILEMVKGKQAIKFGSASLVGIVPLSAFERAGVRLVLAEVP